MKDGKNIKVLIVENEFLIAERIRRMLLNFGYDVCKPVGTGADAIESVKRDKPGVVLMDVRLDGGMNGVEAAMKIRSFSEVSIVFITGFVDQALIGQMKELSSVAWLSKPVAITDIITAIDEVSG